MEPISISIELELATLLLAAVGGIATWMHNKQSRKRTQQRERHHREHMALMQKNGEELRRAAQRVSEQKVRRQSVHARQTANGRAGAPAAARKLPAPPVLTRK